ncbi:hypothetical protein F5884DRAFT_173046 [Xylogone sp. PMI_703]|nr:hypothetical protein F5884DRAFT_173046 [Xylogone sp. PMI_703]
MSVIVDETDAIHLTKSGPQTAAQRVTLAYLTANQCITMDENWGRKWYAPSMYFYNTNGSVWQGAKIAEAGAKLLAPFSVMTHEVDYFLAQPPNNEGKQIVCAFGTRILRLKGRENVGDLRLPFAVRFILGPEEVKGQGVEGLQFHEIRLHWDTASLKQWLDSNELVFRKEIKVNQ